MKVLFVYSDPTCASTKKCCFELAKGIEAYVNSTVICYTNLNKEVVADFDIIIFQRLGANGVIIEPKEVSEIFALIEQYQYSKIFVYLIDDLLLDDQDGLPKEFIKKCTAVICTNNSMKKQVYEYNKNVYVLRTYADMDVIEKTQGMELDGFNIIWASSGGFGIDLMKPLITSIQKELNVRFICIGGSAKFLRGMENTICMQIVPFEQMVAYLKGSQILINPMIPDEAAISRLEKRNRKTLKEFIDSKSEIKYVLAGATHTVLLSSKSDSYAYAITNDENGVFVEDSLEDWIMAIKRLYHDENLRNQITSNAYKDVMKNYSLEQAALNTIIILKELQSNR